MMDRIRSRVRPDAGRPAIARQRRTSRRERELQQRRLLYIGTAVVGTVAVLILIGGAAYQYYFLPRQDLATVNGQAIERRDYWKVRHLQLNQEIAQLSQQYQFVPADQQPQILERITAASEEIDDIENAPIASDTLATMVDDLIVLQSIDDLGITVSDDEVDEFIAEQFAPAPLSEPTQTPTAEPTAAAWATQTADARAAAATETAGASPTAEATETVDGTTTPEATETEEDDATETAVTDVTPTAEAEGSATADDGTPEADGSPTIAPTATLSPTPNADEARATSESTFRQFETNFLDPADMSRDDYRRLIGRPSVARQKVVNMLFEQIPTRAEQVHAAHILVATRDAAQEVINRINNGEDFADIAREVSTDTGTAGTGGDLGWFPRGVMVDPFEEAAFNLEVDEVSEPVQSEFGWHIIKVLEKEDDRPIALATREQLQNGAFVDWLAEQRAEADIESDIEMPQLRTDPTQQDVFQAPPEAPIPPTATSAPTSTLPPDTETPESEASETPPVNGTEEPGATSTP